MGVDLDRLLALLESGLNGFRVFQVEQSRKIGFPVRAGRLELDRPRLVDQASMAAELTGVPIRAGVVR
jgi:hypothetical protein